MHNEPDKDELPLIRQYLLGRLDPPRREAVEARVFTDAGYRERVELAEAELIDEYVEGELAADERRDFAARYLSTPRLRLEVRTVEELRRRAAAEGAAAVAAEPRRAAAKRAQTGAGGPPARRGLAASLRHHAKPLLAAGLALLFISAAVLVWLRLEPHQLEQRLLYGRSPRADLEREVARLNAPRDEAEESAARAARSSAGAGVELTPGVERAAPGDAADATLDVPEGTAYARLRLGLDPAADRFQSFRASFRTVDGGGEFEANLSPAGDAAAGRHLDVTLPLLRLPDGDYRIQLHGRDASGRLEELPGHYYHLRLIRRPR
ncbi:MAG TPA: hypothetical protein VF668_17205 [Pyrinomonadaceae bacterium]|jgi:hypothetical protein